MKNEQITGLNQLEDSKARTITIVIGKAMEHI